MPPDEKSIVDWVNFPDGIPTLSLWDTLHDGDLISIESDLFARTVTLRFAVGYVSNFHHLSEQTRFVIVTSGVRSVRSLRSVPWPGGCSIPQGTPNAQHEALITEYHRKWRQESQSWSDFERSASDGLEVSNAILGRGTDVVALQLGLLMANGSYIEAPTFVVRTLRFTLGKGQLHRKSLSGSARRTGTHLRGSGRDIALLNDYNSKVSIVLKSVISKARLPQYSPAKLSIRASL